MSLKHALLGMLNMRPMSGYELKGIMDHSTQFFWHAQLSQIYPLLKRLDGENLVECEREPQDGKPDRHIYSLTESGREELLEWLNEPLDSLSRGKDTVLLKLFFSGIMEKGDLLAQLRLQLKLHESQLKRFREEIAPQIAQAAANTGRKREFMMWEMVRYRGELHGETSVRWLSEIIEMVEREW